MQGKEIGERFYNNNLTDDKLKSIEVLVDSVLKYRAKRSVIGKDSFDVVKVDVLFNKVIFRLDCVGSKQKFLNNTEFCKEMIELLNGIESIGIPEDMRERLIYKGLILESIKNDLDSIMLKKPKNMNILCWEDIKLIYNNNEFMYISPLEYYCMGMYNKCSLEGIIRYYKNIMLLYLIELSKDKDKIDYGYLDKLTSTLNDRLSDLLKYEMYILENCRDKGFFKALNDYGSIGGDIGDTLELNIISEMLSDKNIMKTCQSMIDKNVKSGINRLYDVVNAIRDRVDMFMNVRLTNDKNMYEPLNSVLGTYMGEMAYQDCSEIIQFCELMYNGVKFLRLNNGEGNCGDLSYFDCGINKEYFDLVDKMGYVG
jgi:hypothetical protein